jgi:hypothetical protein
MKDCKGKYLSRPRQYNQSQKKSLPDNIVIANKYAYGILDGDVWKIDLEEIKSNLFKTPNINGKGVENSINLTNEEEMYFYNDVKINKETNEMHNHLYIPFLDLYMNIKHTIHELFEAAESNFDPNINQELNQNLIHLKICHASISEFISEFKLQVFKKKDGNVKSDLICTRNEKINLKDVIGIIGIKLINDGDIIILTEIGLLIYHFNESKKSISLNYFYYMRLRTKEVLPNYYKDVFSKHNLPLPNYDSFKLCDGWVSNIKDNKEILLKYGVELLLFAIKEHKVELIDEVYKKCINYFKEDLRNNKMFLSIITSTMPLLNKYYPEYILKYSLETTMIIDSPFYKIEHPNVNLHLYSFQYLKIVNLTQLILWTKYNILIRKLKVNHRIMHRILAFIQILIILPFLPIYFVTFHILYKYGFIDHTSDHGNFSFFYFYIIDHIGYIVRKFSKNNIPTITFMNSYIKFVTYPQNYNWFMELIKPQPSPFVETINRDIYKTWNGETLINFKWNSYGKYYYIIIWTGFMALLGCFTVAATIPQRYINEYFQKNLLVASIVLGFIHLSFEVRQFIYKPIKWFQDFWNIFGMY